MIDLATSRQQLAADVDALLLAIDDLAADVPACPGWTVRDLLRHTGKVQRWATACLQAGPDDEVDRPRGPTPDVDPRVWFREGADALLDTLADVDVSAPVQTWAGTRPAGWWVRRLTHETAVHRWDAESARGGPTTPLPATVAADGVAELFEEFLVFADPAKAGDQEWSLHVHLTDVPDGGEWFVTFGPAGVQAEPIHRKADVALRAPASDAFYTLWRRRDDEGLDVVGDRSVLERWREVLVV